MNRISLVMCMGVLAFAARVGLAQGPAGTYTTIDFPGAAATVAQGVDSAGDVVGFFVDDNSEVHGFIFSGGAYTQLDVPGTLQGTDAYGINDLGQVVGSTDSTLGLFVYDTSTQTYTTYQFGNGDYTDVTASSINDADFIVGWAQDAISGEFIGLELKDSTFKQVKIPGAHSTQLTSVNDSGAIIAVATSKLGGHLSYLAQGNGGFEQISVPDYPSAVAWGINNSGVLTGDYLAPGHYSAFEWHRGGSFEPINEPQQKCTYARAVNSSGQVAGYYGCGAGEGFLWTPPAAEAKK